MKIKVSELKRYDLDWAVIDALRGHTGYWMDCYFEPHRRQYCETPSSNWAEGGQIIEREKMSVVRGNDLIFPKGNEVGETSEPLYLARCSEHNSWTHGRTPLEAAMRCYVASKLGDEVEVPDEIV